MSTDTSIKNRFDLSGKVAVVTGASKGIGAAMARGLAEFGAKVMVSSRKPESVFEIAQALCEDGYVARGCAANTGNISDLENLVEETLSSFGGIDIVINNAAANPVYGAVGDTEPRAFDKIIDVNLKGPFELCKLAYPAMKAGGGGSIINISSIGGIVPEQGIGIYSVSKAAIINLTQALAQDWGADGIRANAICPGLIKTRFSEALWADSETLDRFLTRVPLARLGTPEDIAGLGVFLASDAAAYCTGSVYMADGGYTWT